MHNDYLIYDTLYKETMQKGWPGWGGEARIAAGPAQIARIVEKPYLPRFGHTLELGCGEGHLSRLLSAYGYSVTGIDVSSKAIAWALEKENNLKTVTYVQGNLCQSDVLTGERYDLIVDGNCLHCILSDDRPLFLLNVRRHLSVDGIFFLSSLCSKDDMSVTLTHAGQPYRYVPSIEYLPQELENAQFQILDWEVRKRKKHNHINVFATNGWLTNHPGESATAPTKL
jgi:predicted TPR repeat methyltransferase